MECSDSKNAASPKVEQKVVETSVFCELNFDLNILPSKGDIRSASLCFLDD